MNCHIFLTGFMGTGKTTVGKILAQKLSRKFVDADRLMEEKMEMSINEIFARYGEDFFRQKETEILKDLLQIKNEQLIVSLGGGVIIKKENREHLKNTPHALVVNLFASLDNLWERLRHQEDRPLLKNEKPKKTIEELLEQRKNYYNEIPNQINTDKLSPMEVAEEIMRLSR